MARLVFGVPYREVAKQLKERGCSISRVTHSGREVWVTPRGFMFPLTTARKDISSADAMRMNQTLRKEDLDEIRPPSNKKKPKKLKKDKATARMQREEAREEKEQMRPSLPPPPLQLPAPVPVVYRPKSLYEAFKRRYQAAKRRQNGKEEDSNDSSRSSVA